MNNTNIYKRYRFSSEIIQYTVWLYYRFNLNHRDIEDLLAERGINVSYEATRLWCNRFDPKYTALLKKTIGEAENVSSRLKNHVSKEFWTNVAVFVSKDDNLTKAHIRYLEGVLIKTASDNNTARVMNSVGSGASLPESDEAEMVIFLKHALQLLSVLGVKEFDKTLESPTTEGDILTFKIKGVVATGKRTSNGFMVFRGSQAVRENRPSAKWSRKKREELQEKGILETHGDHLVFSVDSEFGSPSTAASMVAGGASNGLTAWKNKKGQSLKELES